MSDVKLTGGTEADRDAILALHERYIDANARYDWPMLETIWSNAPDATFFNLNGHTYKGREHWFKLWKFYVNNVQSTYWTPYDIGGFVAADTAVIWCHRKTRRRWTGSERPPHDFNYDDSEFVSRSTMVFVKEGEQWRVNHTHFSKGEATPRPGGI